MVRNIIFCNYSTEKYSQNINVNFVCTTGEERKSRNEQRRCHFSLYVAWRNVHDWLFTLPAEPSQELRYLPSTRCFQKFRHLLAYELYKKPNCRIIKKQNVGHFVLGDLDPDLDSDRDSYSDFEFRNWTLTWSGIWPRTRTRMLNRRASYHAK